MSKNGEVVMIHFALIGKIHALILLYVVEMIYIRCSDSNFVHKNWVESNLI